MDNPITIAAFLTIALGLFLYAVLVPRNQGRFVDTSKLEGSTGMVKAAAVIGNELYASLPQGVGRPKTRTRSATEDLIQKSGNPWKIAPEQFLFYRFVFAVVALVIGSLLGALVGLLIGMPWWLMSVPAAVFGFMIPKMVYKEAAQKRDLDFKRQLPEALDLLVISLTGRATFPTALRDSLENMQPGVLKDEFREMAKGLDTGKPLSEVLDNFAKKAPNDGLVTFARAVQEATELNSPLVTTLESQADASREELFAIIRTKTASLGMKQMGILTPTLIPAMLITVGLPAAYSALQTLGSGF